MVSPEKKGSRKASDFRYANVLPNPLIDLYAGMRVKAVRFLEYFGSDTRWWKYEHDVEIDFEDSSASAKEKIAEKCGSCGLCCKDIPTHQIAIYMGQKEKDHAESLGHKIITQGLITVEKTDFHVLGVTKDGDCSMLGPKGCTLGEQKPLWCKIYHCEKFQGLDYPFEKKA